MVKNKLNVKVSILDFMATLTHWEMNCVFSSDRTSIIDQSTSYMCSWSSILKSSIST